MKRLPASVLAAILLLIFCLLPAFVQQESYLSGDKNPSTCSNERPETAERVQVTDAVDTAISADGVSISYQVWGEGEPALVFVHGWSCDRSYWAAQVSHFARQYTVVAIDLAGHGDSGLDREVWTMEAFGGDVVAVVERLDLRRIVLIGHSMGGRVIVEAARRMPERVIGLVGADTLNNVEETFTQEEIDLSFAPLRENFAEATSNFVRQSFFTPTSDPALVDLIATDMSSAPPEVSMGALGEYFKHDLITALHEVNAPILCINSDMVPTNVEAGRRHVASFDAVLMSGVGHFVMMEDPETFNRLLGEIIEEFVRGQ